MYRALCRAWGSDVTQRRFNTASTNVGTKQQLPLVSRGNNLLRRFFSSGLFSPKKLPLLATSDEVLFPDCELPLITYEPRYHLLITHVHQSNKKFGWVLGQKNDLETLVPGEFGTFARVQDYKFDKESQKMEVLVKGCKRFKIRGKPERNNIGVYEANVDKYDDSLEKNKKQILLLAREVQKYLKEEIHPKTWKELEVSGQKPKVSNPKEFSFWASSIVGHNQPLKYLISQSSESRLSDVLSILKLRKVKRQAQKPDQNKPDQDKPVVVTSLEKQKKKKRLSKKEDETKLDAVSKLHKKKELKAFLESLDDSIVNNK